MIELLIQVEKVTFSKKDKEGTKKPHKQGGYGALSYLDSRISNKRRLAAAFLFSPSLAISSICLAIEGRTLKAMATFLGSSSSLLRPAPSLCPPCVFFSVSVNVFSVWLKGSHCIIHQQKTGST